MAIAKRLKRAAVAVLTVLGLLLWLVALLLFTRVTENSDEFASRQDVILLINSVGIGVLLILIVSNLWQLVRDYRREDLSVYLKDIAFTASGQPVILYLTSKGFNPGPASGPFQWHTDRKSTRLNSSH